MVKQYAEYEIELERVKALQATQKESEAEGDDKTASDALALPTPPAQPEFDFLTLEKTSNFGAGDEVRVFSFIETSLIQLRRCFVVGKGLLI